MIHLSDKASRAGSKVSTSRTDIRAPLEISRPMLEI